MARPILPLNDSQIRNSKQKEKDYTLSDGNGLYLLVKSSGSKIWRFNYINPVTSKRALISFGAYPNVSLQQARKKREDARESVRQGIDPRENELINKKRAETLKSVAYKWLLIEQSKGYKERTLVKTWQSLEKHIFPFIGDMPINEITSTLLINTLTPLQANKKFDMLRRVIMRVNKIMDYAVNYGLLEVNKVSKVNKPELCLSHHNGIPFIQRNVE